MHAGPIIRKENEFKNLNILTRRRIFNKMSFFANHVDFKYASVMVDKKHIDDELYLIGGSPFEGDTPSLLFLWKNELAD